MTALELMLALETALYQTGEDFPVVYRDSDSDNPIWFAPVKWYGTVGLIDDQNRRDRVFIVSDVQKPFPNNCYRKNPDAN